QTIFRLVEPQAGEIFYQGQNVLKMNQTALRKFRQRAQLIFQDPFGCLNPRLTAGQIIAEPLKIHWSDSRNSPDLGYQVAELLRAVNLESEAAVKFPNEFSGGQARRIGLALAVALNPDFIVADEPTSGLDISTAATILNLMQDLQERFELTYLWISHNLNQVKYMTDDVAVMYMGKVVEVGRTSDVFSNLAHPYSRALISAVPQVGGTRDKKSLLQGEIPSPINPPSGCRFRTRCPQVMARCREEEPRLIDLGSGHRAACHRLEGGSA
ncbi:MAG: ATP-binding cassette domain-containing protein, partial [Deltaproteobacteria bacterium]|nr:ATP-binding cassette domain-containing protein [Deltaproteobacteria bacterium]